MAGGFGGVAESLASVGELVTNLEARGALHLVAVQSCFEAAM